MLKKWYTKMLYIFLVALLLVQLIPPDIIAQETADVHTTQDNHNVYIEKSKLSLSFLDVNLFEDEINQLIHLGIVKGYPDGTFKPHLPVTRLQAVTMIIREMNLSTSNRPDPHFKDVRKGMLGYDVVATAVDEGIIIGRHDKTFAPHEFLTRAEMAKILVRAYKLNSKKPVQTVFKDISEQHWAYHDIFVLAEKGIVKGYTDGTFRPRDPITRAHFAVFLARYINKVKNDYVDNNDSSIEKWEEKFVLRTDKSSVNYGEVCNIFLDVKGDESVRFTVKWKATGGDLVVADDGKSSLWRMKENISDQYTIYVEITIYIDSGKTVTLNKSVSIEGKRIESGRSSPSNPLEEANSLPSVSPGRVLTFEDGEVTLLSTTKIISSSQASTVEISPNQNEISFQGIVSLKVGDVFLLPPSQQYPSGLARKVTEVKYEDGKTIVQTVQPQLEEVFYSIKANFEAQVDASHFEPAQGVTVSDGTTEQKQYSNRRNLYAFVDGESKEYFNLVGLKAFLNSRPVYRASSDKSSESIKLEWGVGTKIEMKLETRAQVKLDWGAFKPDSFDIYLEMNPNLLLSLEPNWGSKKNLEKKLGNFRIPTSVPFLTIEIPVFLVAEVNMGSNVGLELDVKMKLGVRYPDDTDAGMEVYPGEEERIDANLEFTSRHEIGGKLGLNINALLDVASISLVGTGGEIGFTLLMTGKDEVDFESRCFSTEQDVSLYYKIFINSPLFDKTVNLKEYSRSLYNRENKWCDRQGAITVKGGVVDTSLSTPVDGVSVEVYSGDNLMDVVVTNDKGEYEVKLEPGTYRFVVKHPDYETQSKIVTVDVSDKTVDFVLVPVMKKGIISGVVKDDVTDSHVSGAKLLFRPVEDSVANNRDVVSVQTDLIGYYSLELPEGKYEVEVKKEGYESTYFEVTIVKGINFHKDVRMMPVAPKEVGLNGDNIKIVLSWEFDENGYGYQVEPFLSGSTSDRFLFEVNQSQPKYEDEHKQVFLLPAERQEAFIQTIKMNLKSKEGTYSYAVYAPNHQVELGKLRYATIRVYDGDELVAIFNIPKDQQGSIWKVFEIRDGLLVPFNKVYSNSWTALYPEGVSLYYYHEEIKALNYQSDPAWHDFAINDTEDDEDRLLDVYLPYEVVEGNVLEILLAHSDQSSYEVIGTYDIKDGEGGKVVQVSIPAEQLKQLTKRGLIGRLVARIVKSTGSYSIVVRPDFVGNRIIFDSSVPRTTITNAVYNPETDTLTLFGERFDEMHEYNWILGETDISYLLDYSKITFITSEGVYVSPPGHYGIEKAVAENEQVLHIKFGERYARYFEQYMLGNDGLTEDDKIKIEAGFTNDPASNASRTDGLEFDGLVE